MRPNFLRFGIFPPQISESWGATYRRNSKMFSALQSTYGTLTTSENSVQIDAWLATLSFPKLVQNWPKCGSEFGALLYRQMAPKSVQDGTPD